MTKGESRLKIIFSQLKPAKEDCCSVTIEEVKASDCYEEPKKASDN